LAEFILNENPQEGAKFTAILNEDKSGLKITLSSEVRPV
jgi:hypothetical protein